VADVGGGIIACGPGGKLTDKDRAALDNFRALAAMPEDQRVLTQLREWAAEGDPDAIRALAAREAKTTDHEESEQSHD
jgi:hypothetical protein